MSAIDTNKAREIAQEFALQIGCGRRDEDDAKCVAGYLCVYCEQKDNAAALLLQLAEAHDRMAKDAARYSWLADKVLACDYGDNSREDFAIGWIIRHCKGPSVIYGPSIDTAIDAAMGADNG